MSNNNIIQRLKNKQQKQKNESKHEKDKTLTKFGIISGIIFSIIVIFSLVYIGSCSGDGCSSAYLQSMQAIILSAGLIGLGYCLITLKTFDVKLDKELESNYNTIIQELDKSDNKQEK